ncbi:hypothetical protein [Odoribacter sp. AF15-53]|uniref:hypothetical protein n=1 Tax=Odoribacter sp. AF15-53 TaxID=2292236 RepID=UPI000E4AF5E0|nr:hypothetical protein [Odoribacter sp. AF15-53]RHR77740.1 hypothetical protein DWW52_13790 [Odoribacter sp. AF15-53]
MKLEELIDIIRSGRKEGDDIRNMELLIEQFPYFSTARTVYLKMLHASGHSAYPEKLKHNTIYIPNHKQFYRFLNNLSQPDDVQNQMSGRIPVVIELLEDKEEEKRVVPAVTFYQLEKEFPEEEFLPIDAIANEWLTRKKQKEEREDSLIDKFIQTEPSMPKITENNVPSSDVTTTDTSTQPEFFSETLAKIYVRQQLYDKAIATYLKLSLKYPEKSVYFAVQIEKIKEKINNNTN